MKHRVIQTAAVAVLAFFSSGCATMFLRQTQELEVVTDPPGATATTGDASVATPGKLNVRRQKGEVVIRIEKEGFETRLVSLKFGRAGAIWAASAFFLGGLAGGVVKDAADNFNLFGPSGNKTSAATTGAAVGAAVTAAAVAVDLSSDKTYSLERDSIAVRLKPLALSTTKGGSP